MDDNKVVWEAGLAGAVVHHLPVPAIRDVIISHNHQNYYSHYPTAITTLSLHDLYQYFGRWAKFKLCYKYKKTNKKIETQNLSIKNTLLYIIPNDLVFCFILENSLTIIYFYKFLMGKQMGI